MELNKLLAVVDNTSVERTPDGEIVNWNGVELNPHDGWGCEPWEVQFHKDCTAEEARVVLDTVCGKPFNA